MLMSELQRRARGASMGMRSGSGRGASASSLSLSASSIFRRSKATSSTAASSCSHNILASILCSASQAT